ncbi:Dynein light chain 1, cytoplasmic [Tritrichomonas foetus]|uniref:Dynein light chain n=1 Tax=Tritrichomonas foetus TaxID=1144522 RepID=A0A1J4IZU4_9EUKA|nr:Dynein light chain 1, cytoplasmic [Tritrichomonas foetus]|eukprot:OHS92698.1 Dynein light chain 1, cytoplasmic [Tritrichomonas foetus]
MASTLNNNEDRIVIVNSDCTPELLERIKAECLYATARLNTHAEMATTLKDKIEALDGKTWNVIVGHNFAANVKHIAEKFVYLYIDQLGFLLFKAQ